MKSLIFAGALFLSAFTTIPATFAASYIDSINTGVKVIHIDDSTAIPNNAISRSATYKINIHVEGKSLSSLAINLPEDLSVNNVEVTDRSGKPIANNATVGDKEIAITFNSPVTSESFLQVRLLGTSTRWNNSNTWLLPVFAKVEGISDSLSLGLARIQTYGH